MTDSAIDHVSAGLKLFMAGDTASAAARFENALKLQPTQPDALHLLGVIAFQAGDPEKALPLIQAALAVQPAYADAESNLGAVLMAMGRWADAESAQRRAIALNPKPAAYHFNLGNILAAQKKLKDAIPAYSAALERQPVYAEAWNNLGTVHRDLEDAHSAFKCYKKAVSQRPTYTEAWYNLGNSHRDFGQLSDAEGALRKAIELSPTHAKAYNSLGNILSESGRSDQALSAFETSAKLEPTSQAIASNYLSCLQYVPGIDDNALGIAHTHWVGAFNDIFTAPQHSAPDKNPERTLNVGFISPDFGNHPCGYLSVRLFEYLVHKHIRPIVFSTRAPATEDDISQRIISTTEWHRVVQMSDAELARFIVDAKVDVLVDMSGHTSKHRLGVFGRKAAPLQMSWLGYVGTTGLPTMDYVIADRWHAPEGYTLPGPEKILRLADGYTCFDPPISSDALTALPAMKNGFVTFGSLNNATKLNAILIASYAAIMRQVQNSRIILAFRGLDDPGTKRWLLDLFHQHGIESNRIDIRGYAKRPKFLAIYNEIDLALDTFPYSGGLTTCEALWMGVPVVTFPGRTFAGRHSTSYMNNAGLADFVATDQATFEHLAINKAQDLAALSQLRASLRDRLLASPVCDGQKFAASFTDGLRQAWRNYCGVSP